MRTCFKIALGATAMLSPIAAAQAGTATANIAVSANVVAVCTVGAAPLSFGNYSGAQISATTTISPNCSNGTPYTIAIDAGSNTANGATTTLRKLGNGAGSYLNYSIYTSTAYTTAWGTTIGTDTVGGTGTGVTQTVQVYGRIPAGQSSTVGTGYTDTVSVTLNF